MGFGYVCRVCVSLVRIGYVYVFRAHHGDAHEGGSSHISHVMRTKEAPLMSLVRIAFGLQVFRRAFKDAFNTRS